MAATGTRSKSLDDHMDKQDTTIQHMQGEMLQMHNDVQMVCAQMNDSLSSSQLCLLSGNNSGVRLFQLRLARTEVIKKKQCLVFRIQFI